MNISRIIIFFSCILFFGSCNRSRLKVDISGIKVDIEFVNFNNELFALPLKDTLSELKTLHTKYPEFFDLFTYKIIRVGGIEENDFKASMTNFLTDTMILNVKSMVEKKFGDFDKTREELGTAFKYFQYHFPSKTVPNIYTYISGFNQSVVTTKDLIGISLDKYLGRDCIYYKMLSTTPDYKVKNMYKKKIPADVAYAWGMTEFGGNPGITTLLDNMINEGKLMYFTEAMLPDAHDSLLIGYTKKELDWCKKNESQMWVYLVERKLLYSNKRMDIVRYINDAPHTSGFPLESPGRAGVWIGWQIVREYMKKNKETTLRQLMENKDYQGILNASGYFPE